MAEAWYSCDVNAAGAASDGAETADPVIYIRLTDSGGAFEGYWFYAAENSRNEMLATALGAISAGRRITVAAEEPVADNASYTQIYRLYLQA